MAEPEYLPHGEDNAPHMRSTQQARQAATTGHMRYVLIIGILLVVLFFGLVWLGVL